MDRNDGPFLPHRTVVGRDPSAPRDPDASFLRTLAIGAAIVVAGVIGAIALVPTSSTTSIATRPAYEEPQTEPTPTPPPRQQ